MVEFIYVCDFEVGIVWVCIDKGFDYYFGKKLVILEKYLKWIKSLVILLVWENVWICCFENGYI